MSSTTPNLELILPIGTENVSRQIINENNMKIDSAFGRTLRPIPFALAVGDWSASGNDFVANYITAYVTDTSIDVMTWGESYGQYAKADVIADKISGGGGITFKTHIKPSGTIMGTIYTIDAPDGKVPVLIEGTVTPIANGGTGQSSLAGAKQVLGITDLADHIANFVKTDTLTATTSSSGNITSSISATSKMIVGAYAYTGGNYVICLPYFYSNYWYFHIANSDASMTAIANQSVTIEYAYIDL